MALVAEGRLEEFWPWRPGRPDGVGDWHRAHLGAHRRGLAGSFVELAGAPPGFLPDSARLGSPEQGRALCVCVTRAAQHGKGPRLREIAAPSAEAADGPARLLRRGPGPVERLAARWPDAPVLADDAAVAAMLPGARLVRRAFDESLEEAVAALASPTAALPDGGTLHVEQTRALTAIDLDWHGAAPDKRRGLRHFVAGCLPELARQIWLRHLAGIILIDCSFLPARERPSMGVQLATSLQADPAGCRFVGFTGLGLAELVRQRIHPPLAELLTGPHAAAIAAARAAAATAMPRLRAAPSVIGAIEQDAFLRDGLERALPRGLVLQSDPSLPACGWHLETP